VEIYSEDHNVKEGSFIWYKKKGLGQEFEMEKSF
jgi:hypothetical protein